MNNVWLHILTHQGLKRLVRQPRGVAIAVLLAVRVDLSLALAHAREGRPNDTTGVAPEP